MKNMIYMRNPESGLLETKEFADAQLGLLRIADPVATSLVQGFTNADLIGDKFFPSVRMAKETGRFPAFGKEAWFIPANIKRAIGEKVQRIQTQTGYITMALSEYALGVAIENRERNEWAGSPDMLVNGKLMQVADKIALFREKLQATLLTTAGSYGTGLATSGAGKAWATTGDPVKDMLQLIQDVQSQIGKRPNKVWFTPTSWLLFINNTAVLNRIKYGGSPITPAQMSISAVAQLLQVEEVAVGYSVYSNTTYTDGGVKKKTVASSYIWDSVVQSSNAGCAFVGKGGGIEASFGYTYERMNSPVIESYYDNSTKSQVWDYEHFFDPAVTLPEAGGMYYSLA